MDLKKLTGTLMASLAFLYSAAAFSTVNLAEAIASGERETAFELISNGADIEEGLSDGTTAIIYAAHQGDAELVKALLEAGADPQASNEYGAFALSEAAMIDANEVIALLLEYGADPNQTNHEGETALLVSAHTGNVEGAKLLLEHGADVNTRETWGGQTPLMWAAAQKHVDLIPLLIRHGADLDAQGAVRLWERRITSEPRPKDMNKGGFTALHYAARQGCIECINLLAEAGADLDSIDPDRVTPLNIALLNFQFDAAGALIETGADVDKWDLFGRTPLFNAADLNTTPTGGRKDIPSDDALTGTDVTRMLLERGADPNIQLKMRPPYRNVPFDRGADGPLSTGATPLLRAARAADNGIVKLLLEHGALVDLPNAQGHTPLMIVSGMSFSSDPTRGEFKTEEDSIETIRLLLAAGADINALSGNPYQRPLETAANTVADDGPPSPSAFGARFGGFGGNQSALQAAIGKNWSQIVGYLLENGADYGPDERGRSPMQVALGNSEGPTPENIETIRVIQEHCLATVGCELEQVFDFSDL